MSVKQVIVMRTDLNMRKGKMCAQAAHAAMKVFFDRMKICKLLFSDHEQWDVDFTIEMLEWMQGTFTKIVVGISSLESLIKLSEMAAENDLPFALIQDHGKTEFKCSQCDYINDCADETENPEAAHKMSETSSFDCLRVTTCLAIGPAKSELIDVITKNLKLI